MIFLTPSGKFWHHWWRSCSLHSIGSYRNRHTASTRWFISNHGSLYHRPSFYDGSIIQALGQLGQFWVEERLCQEPCAHRHSAGAMLFKIIYRSSGTFFRFNDTISSCTKPGQDPASAVYSLKQEEEHPAQDHARGLICPRLPKGGQKSDLVVRWYTCHVLHGECLKIYCIRRE